MTLKIITTGGTFEKHYDPIAGKLTFNESKLPELLSRPGADIPITELTLVDSLEMTTPTRALLTNACRNASETELVIIHGTDTLVESARAVAAANLPKTIVFTGAMVPYEVTGSDAQFNLGFAIASAQQAKPGVWIAMHAQLFPWDSVWKNTSIAKFQWK